MARVRGRFALLGVLALLGLAGLLLYGTYGRRGADVHKAGAGPTKPSIYAAEPGVDESAPPGAIAGRVTGPAGAPIAGATVVLTRARDRKTPWSGDFGRPLSIVRSDGAGRFRLQAVHAGSYTVGAMARGHLPAQQSPVQVSTGQTAEVALELGSGGIVLSGRVFDVGGGVLPGATVRAVGIRRPGGADATPLVFAATTDDQGSYQLHLSPGQYSVSAEADGYAPASDWVMLSGPLTRDLRLSPAARIVGRVVDASTSQPVAGAELWLISPREGRMPFGRDVKSDDNGEYAFNALEPGTYRVGARKSRLVGMSAPVSVALAGAAADVVVPVHAGLVVAGKVTKRSGQPVEGAQLFLFKNQPPRERPLMTRTEKDGAFKFEGALPGPYALQTRVEGLSGDYRDLRLVKDEADLKIELGGGASLTGQVLAADGRPLDKVSVNVRVMPKDRTLRGAFELVATDARGKFELDGLPAGELNVTAQHEEAGVASKEKESLAEAEKKVVTLKLEPGASISGTVRLDDGRPAVGARVGAMPRRGGVSGQWMQAVDGEGRFKLSGLPPGPVTVVASNSPSMRWGGTEERPDQKTVTLAEKEQKADVDLVVPGAMSINGVVVGPDGKPVGGAQVSAALEEEGRPARGMFGAEKAFTDFDGQFTIERLGKGPHTVWAELAGYGDAQAEKVASGSKGIKLVFPRESTLAGLVTAANGTPVPDYTIVLLPGGKPGESPRDRQERMRFSWQSPTDIVHDPTGRFLFRGVSQGLYELRVTTAGGSGGSQTVTVAEGEEKRDVRVVVDLGGRIVGRIVDLDGDRPLAGVEVRAFSMGGNRNQSVVRTDPTGKFAVEGMPSGEQVMLLLRDPEEKHINERRQIEVKRGGDVDLGTIRLQAGSVKARMDEGTWNGMTGLSSSTEDGSLVDVIRPGTPAAAAGIKSGDRILSIDGKDVRGMSFGQVEWRLRGKPGSNLTVTVQSAGAEPRTVTFARYDPENPATTAAGARPAAAARPATPATPAR